MGGFKILNIDQVSSKDKLSMFEEIDLGCKPTDLAQLLGAKVSARNNNTQWWLDSNFTVRQSAARCVGEEGDCNAAYSPARNISTRPSSSMTILKTIMSGRMGNEFKTYYEYYAGEYPQSVINKELSEELDSLQISGDLKYTGKQYTFDSNTFSKTKFYPRSCAEYAYKGDKYIKLKVILEPLNPHLRNGEEIQKGKEYWVKVEPIKWLIDKNTETALADQALFSGVFLEDFSKPNSKHFESTTLGKYLKYYFSKDIIPSRDKQKEDREF